MIAFCTRGLLRRRLGQPSLFLFPYFYPELSGCSALVGTPQRLAVLLASFFTLKAVSLLFFPSQRIWLPPFLLACRSPPLFFALGSPIHTAESKVIVFSGASVSRHSRTAGDDKSWLV